MTMYGRKKFNRQRFGFEFIRHKESVMLTMRAGEMESGSKDIQVEFSTQ